MAFPSFLFLMLSTLLSSIPYSQSTSPPLTLDYYAKTCPSFDQILQEEVFNKQLQNPTTAAATLRVFFHDCMVDGCDASVLISSNNFNTAERDSDINLSLAGDAFALVANAKSRIELACPAVVSCADILAVATRNLVMMVGGPHYNVSLGRKDGLISNASHVEGHLSRPNMTLDQIISIFGRSGFSVKEMVALTGGGHTIGFAHCNEFMDRLSANKSNGSKPSNADSQMLPKYAAALKKLCANYTVDPAMSGFLDVMTPGKFDNMYFQNLLRGMGLLESDRVIAADPRTKPLVEMYATDQTAFFNDFAAAMEKVSVVGVKTGQEGEVRRQCNSFNSIKL